MKPPPRARYGRTSAFHVNPLSDPGCSPKKWPGIGVHPGRTMLNHISGRAFSHVTRSVYDDHRSVGARKRPISVASEPTRRRRAVVGRGGDQRFGQESRPWSMGQTCELGCEQLSRRPLSALRPGRPACEQGCVSGYCVSHHHGLLPHAMSTCRRPRPGRPELRGVRVVHGAAVGVGVSRETSRHEPAVHPPMRLASTGPCRPRCSAFRGERPDGCCFT